MPIKLKYLSSLTLCLAISDCASQGLIERERRANNLESQAEQAREQNNYYHADDLERQARKTRENDTFDKSNAAIGIVLFVGKWIASLFK